MDLDEKLAAKLLQVFMTKGPAGASGIDFFELARYTKIKKCSVLKRVIRSRPAQFAMFNRGKRQVVTCLATVHMAAAESAPAGSDVPPPFSDTSKHGLYCSTCNMRFTSALGMQQHLAGSRHKVTKLVQQVKQSGSVHANQQGIHISELPELQGLQVGQSRVVAVEVENQGTVMQHLNKIYQVRPLPEVQVQPSFGPEGVYLFPGDSLSIPVEVTPSSYGIICTLLIFDFGFVIGRELRAECDPVDDPTLPDISATAPYTAQHFKLPAAPAAEFVPGERERRTRTPFLKPPRQHPVPDRLRQLVLQQRLHELQQELDRYRGPSSLANHLSKLHLLLHLEELQQEIDVRTYDMTGVELTRSGSGHLLSLKVPGLAESRPSVMRGDALYVVPSYGGGGGKEWQGFVHMVRQEEVLLRFNSRFHNQVHMTGMKFNVRFAIKRSSFVFMHEALDVISRGVVAGSRSELLLPPADACCKEERHVLIPLWFNNNIFTNPEQQEAVRCVVSGSSGKLPFIIWGPPGTGKTSTLVEAAAQVLKLLPSSRLLLVAPSNLAADLLAQRLIKAGRPKSEMLRVCAFSRPKEDLPTDLLDITCWDDAACAFKLPPLEAVTASRVRVVVVTALMAAKLHALGVKAGHFSHIMMDEAGHAEEPLALCALAGLTGRNTSVVLAGDPKQLGPVVHSRLAAKEGLQVSLLERLTTSLPYAAAVDGNSSGSGSSNPAAGLIVKLVRNYRSHPKLLELPSRLFYAGELQACASPEITHTLLHWEKLPNKGFPILFHSIVGKDEREANSPSWFNVLEAKMVLAYVQELLSMRGRNPVTAAHIGVITPYRKQVQKLRRLLEAKGLDAVQVGSVEQLQGQERRVIIISTVRSDPNYLEHDFKHKLGFVASPKRFNVAITRAQALMIVVGNPSVLKHDKHWLQLMLSCQMHGSVTGQAMPDLAAAAAATAAEAETTEGAAGSAASSGAFSNVEQEIAELEKLMASLTLSRAAEQVAAQQQRLQDMLVGFSGLAVEAGGGMVRHE